MKVYAIALNTFREALRNKIMYAVVVFATVLVGISAFFGAVSIGSQEQVIKDFGLFALSFFGAIITMLSGVSLLNKELKQKTVYNILSKPLDRWQFILGKYLGLGLTVNVLVAMMGCALVGFVALFEGAVDWHLFQGIVFILLEVWIVAAVTMFFSSVVITTTLTGIFTLATYLAGRSINYLEYFFHGHEENPLLARLMKVFDWIIPDLSLFNVNDAVVYGEFISFTQLCYAFVYCASYAAVALLLATVIFNRRELV